MPELNLGFVLLLLLGGGIFFGLGYYWHSKTSRVKWLIKQSNLKAKQILELEQINKEVADKNLELYAKELELSLAYERLQSLETAKSKFVAVTTHQLRTPLAAIKWSLDLTVKEQLGPLSPDQKNFLQKALISTERVISIVNDLLKIDLVDEKQETYNFEETDLLVLVEGVLFEFSNQILSKKIDFKVKRPTSKLPKLELDGDKLRIVLENLIDNALKYTPVGGQVNLDISDERLNSATPEVLISVRDSGIGIPTTETDKVFQKFFRAANAIKTEPDGSGLGLFIARDIIERHGGTMWFKNEPERGAKFSFTLPLHQKKV